MAASSPICQMPHNTPKFALRPLYVEFLVNIRPTEKTASYSRRQWTRAVNLSAVLGWLCVAVSITVGMSSGELLGFFGLMIWAAVIGLPIAFAASWLILAPILKRVMHSSVTWLGAAFWGGVPTFLIVLASVVIGRFRSWMQPVNPNSFSHMGSGDKLREVDGILTAYGWWILAQTTAMFVLAGVVIALIVRAIIGPGNTV
jgi:hypothetical protein